MKNFFHNFKRSLSDTSLYREVTDGTHPFKVRYAFGLSLILSIIIGILLTIEIYTGLVPDAKEFAATEIPADLVVTVNSGELSINQPLPYIIPLDAENQTPETQNMLVIDTESTSALESFAASKTIIFANKNTVVVQGDRGKIDSFPLSDVPNFTLTRESALQFIDSSTPWLWLIPVLVLIPVMLFQFVLFMFIFLFSAVIVWIVFKVSSRNLTFGQAFTASMYAYTAVFILDILVFIFNVYNIGVFMSALFTAIIALVALFSKPEPAPVVVVETEPAPTV